MNHLYRCCIGSRKPAHLHRLFALAGLGLIAAGAMAMPDSAQAQPYMVGNKLYYDFNAPVPENTPDPGPAGSYWLRAIVSQDAKLANQVTVRLEANTTLTSGAFIDSVAFSIAGYNGGVVMKCSPPATSGICATGPSVTPPDNKQNPQSWGYTNHPNPGQVNLPNQAKGLDLQIFLPTSNKPGVDRLNGAEHVEFLLQSSYDTKNFNNLQQALFGATPLAGGPNGDYTAVAKMQGYGGSTTLFDGPPEPAPAPLPLLGAIAAFQASRRLRRRLQAAPEAAVEPSTANGPGAVLLTVPVRARRPA